MEITSQTVKEILAKSIETTDVQPDDIPNLDLYMDQVITVFEEKLSGNKRREEDKLLTKTMINNYSKAGILQPIKGKKYSKEHILQMLFIYNLKQTLSIADIQRLTQDVGEELRQQGLSEKETLPKLYERFLASKEEQRVQLIQAFDATVEKNAVENRCDLYEIVLSLCSMSNLLRIAAERIIDVYFEDDQGKKNKDK